MDHAHNVWSIYSILSHMAHIFISSSLLIYYCSRLTFLAAVGWWVSGPRSRCCPRSRVRGGVWTSLLPLFDLVVRPLLFTLPASPITSGHPVWCECAIATWVRAVSRCHVFPVEMMAAVGDLRPLWTPREPHTACGRRPLVSQLVRWVGGAPFRTCGGFSSMSIQSGSPTLYILQDADWSVHDHPASCFWTGRHPPIFPLYK